MSELVDPCEPLEVEEGEPSHQRLGDVVSGGYFCMNCGCPVTSTPVDHGEGVCETNTPLVRYLRELNLW